jgi:RNA polymerase sigma factor (sigma-70 family)
MGIGEEGFREHDMAGGRIYNLIRFLYRTTAPGEGPDMPDAQLLERFAVTRDEAAFELLARRHGPMVLGVCRRILGDAHDAEDAFQATFLVLARKAASAARSGSAGGWLYTVAYRVALRARARRAGRAGRERPLEEAPMTGPGPAEAAAWREVRGLIDEEVSRLPEKYRVPFVLFHLEGRSNAEVAQALGCPVGTVESWLSRARERLRNGLSRRGLQPASGFLAAVALHETALPEASARAARAAAQGATASVSAEATALAGEVLRAATLARIKLVVALLLLLTTAAVGLTLGLLPRAEPPVQPTLAELGRREETPESPPPEAPKPVRLGSLQKDVGPATAIAFSPTNLTLVQGDHNSGIKLWDVAGLRMEKALYHGHPFEPHFVEAVAFSPDGKTFASGSVDRTVKLWDVAQDKAFLTLSGSYSVYSVAFSPKGRILASAGGGYPVPSKPIWSFDDIPKDAYTEFGEVTIWELDTGRRRTPYRENKGRVFGIAFSPDGKLLAGCVRDKTIRVWDVETGIETACLREDDLGFHSLAFSPDGKTLAAATWGPGATIRLWDLPTRRVRTWLKGHRGSVQALAFNPDGILASGANITPFADKRVAVWQGEVILWDGCTGLQRGDTLTFNHLVGNGGVAFGGAGRILAVCGERAAGGGEITLWDLSGPAPAP